MKILRKQKKPARPILAIILVLIATLAIGGLYLGWKYIHKDMKSSTVGIDQTNLSKPTQAQKTDSENIKDKALTRDDAPLKPSGTEASPLTIVSASFNEREDGVVVETKISNIASWDTCTLQMGKDGKIIKLDARVVYQDENSFCGGFFVPKDKLSTGTWSIAVNVKTIGGQTYEVNSVVMVP